MLQLCVLGFLLGAASATVEEERFLVVNQMFDAFDTNDTNGELSVQAMISFYLQYQDDPTTSLYLTEDDFCTGERNFTDEFFIVFYYDCASYFKLLDMDWWNNPLPIYEAIETWDVEQTFLELDFDGNGRLSRDEWRNMTNLLRPVAYGSLFLSYSAFDGS